ncbi:MAG: ADP-ribosylglycohydrolase family protein, partial [Planctomycetota bacterium]|nr:ADP-ribosylglycohydrolase family protein [Planctomycetota bacterium]
MTTNFSTILHDKILGALYGLVTGDALGCPVEGWKQRDIIRDYGQVTEMLESKKRWRPKGLHSDDAQQALGLCDALLLNPDDPTSGLAQFFVDLYREGPKTRGSFGGHRGTGKNFRVMTRLLANHCPPEEAAQPSAGNGVAMMIAPAGLYFRDDEEALSRCVLQVGLMKQRDPRGIAAAGAVAYLCKEGLGSFSFSELSRRSLLQFVQGIEHRACAAIENSEHRHSFS